MEVFNGVVRLAGSLTHEVTKRGMTVPEILVLRKIHGIDGVVRLQHVGNCFIDDDDERERLNYAYGDGLNSLGDDEKTTVEKMFGTYGALPSELKNYDGTYSAEEKELEEFQASEPFASANYEDANKKAQAEKAAKRKAAAAKAEAKTAATTKKPDGKKSNLDAVL